MCECVRNESGASTAAAKTETPEEAGISSLLLTVIEVAETLGVSRSTVYGLLYSRRIPSVRIGNCRRIRRSDLDAFVRDLVEVS